MPAAIDYTGMKFGKLTAVSYVGNRGKGKRRVWLFRCECGAEVLRTADNVRRTASDNYVPACPSCRQYYDGTANLRPPTRVDITGQKFGKLTAIRSTGKVNKRRYAIWEFQCECGAVVEKSAGAVMQTLRRKDTRTVSCGNPDCMMHERLPGSDGAFHRLYENYKRNALYRHLSFDLTKDQARLLFQQDCFYCGVEPSQIAKPYHKSHAPAFIYNGIDRLHNDLGYIEGNVVACCGTCNRAKNNLSYEQFMEWINRIVQHNS